MRGRVYVGYKLHKKKKSKRLKKLGSKAAIMEMDQFDRFTGEIVGTKIVRVKIEEAYRTRDHIAQQLEDIEELIADLEKLLA